MRASIRKALTFLLGAIFTVIVIGVGGEFLIEVAREKGAYQNAAAAFDGFVGAVMSFLAQAWVAYPLGALAGLVAGVWLDTWLQRKERPGSHLAFCMGRLFGMMPEGVSWPDNTPEGTSWTSEIASLHLQMMKAGFKVPPIKVKPGHAGNLNLHRAYLADIIPLVRDGQTEEAKALSAALSAKLASEASIVS